MRTLTVVLSFGMTVMLLGCGLLNSGENPPDSERVTPSAMSEDPQSGEGKSPDSECVAPTAVSEGLQSGGTPQPALSEDSQSLGILPPFYFGASSLEERILASPVIARVRLDSTTSTVESGTTYLGIKCIAILEFNFSVVEYLKGSGPTDIVAIWGAGQIFDTQQEAQGAMPAIVAGAGHSVGRP